MKVAIFIARPANDAPPVLLVLPDAPIVTVPRDLHGPRWSYFVTTTIDDKLIGAPTAEVEASLAQHGYALVSPTA